jgi:hypothetical protein
MIVSSALMIWKGLMVVTGSESPIVVVLRLVYVSEPFFTISTVLLVMMIILIVKLHSPDLKITKCKL